MNPDEMDDHIKTVENRTKEKREEIEKIMGQLNIVKNTCTNAACKNKLKTEKKAFEQIKQTFQDSWKSICVVNELNNDQMNMPADEGPDQRINEALKLIRDRGLNSSLNSLIHEYVSSDSNP